MKDLFQRAHQMHQMNQAMGVAAPAAPAMPAAPGKSPAPALSSSAPIGNFMEMSKQMGLHGVKLDKNPTIARTQLMTHLQQKFGPQFLAHPGVRDLLNAFNQHSSQPSTREMNALSSQGQRTAKALMGG